MPAPMAQFLVRCVAFYVAVLAALDAAGLAQILLLSRGDPRPGDLSRLYQLSIVWLIVEQALLSILIFAFAPLLARGLNPNEAAGVRHDPLAIGRLAMRLAGILVVDHALSLIPHAVSAVEWRDSEDPTPSLLLWLPPVLVALLGVGLFTYSRALARRVLGSAAGEETSTSALAQALGFSLLGTWLLVASLPEAMERVVAWSWGNQAVFNLSSSPAAAGLFVPVVRLALGLLLFLGGGWFARLWRRAQTAGLEPRT